MMTNRWNTFHRFINRLENALLRVTAFIVFFLFLAHIVLSHVSPDADVSIPTVHAAVETFCKN